MHSADSAVLILSLVASPECADSMVGDLLEGEGANSRWQFWFAVVRTAVSQLWRQIATAPFSMTRIAILGMFVEVSYILAAALLCFALLLCIESVLRVTFHRDVAGWQTQWLPYLMYNLWVPFELGRWMFRRCPGREAMGTLTMAILHASINLCAGWIFWQAARAGNGAHADVTIFVRIIDWNGDVSRTLARAAFYLTLYPVIVLAGAASARNQSRAARHSGQGQIFRRWSNE
jgi:hypothetical protein